MPDVKISELPTKTIAGTDMVPVVDTGATTTSRVTAADIAGLVTDASQLTTGTLPDARLSADVVLTGDSRLSDSRTPTAHNTSHATGGSDALTASDIGAAAASHSHAISDVTNLQTTLDGKASSSHAHAAADITSGTLSDDRLSASVVLTGDSRLSDSRTPTAHKSSHAAGGSDALSPSDIGAANASHTHAASTDITGLSTVATSGSYNDLTDKPAASSGISIATVWALS